MSKCQIMNEDDATGGKDNIKKWEEEEELESQHLPLNDQLPLLRQYFYNLSFFGLND